MARTYLVPLVLVIFLFSLVQAQAAFSSTMTSLQESLIGNSSSYKKTVRPDTFVTISIENVLRYLLKLDISDESMILYNVWNMAWTDSRLTWTPADWDNISVIYLPAEDIWRAPLFVDNAVDADGYLEPEAFAFVWSDGTVVLPVVSAPTTSCDVSTKHYPFDVQTCEVKVELWGLTMHYDFNLTSPAVYTGLYHPSAEWDLVEYTAVKGVMSRTAIMSLPRITYTFTFRRLIPYYFLAMITPILLLMCLVCTVFWVPIESGEKLGYCLTLLLNFVVLLTLVSEELPPLAQEINILQILLCAAMSASVLATLITILVLYLYHKEASEPVPGWLAKLSSFVMKPCKGRGCRNKTNDVDSFEKQEECGSISKHNPWVTPDVSWQLVAKALDKMFLWFFLFVMLVITIGIMAGITEHQ